jgi:hypothetical protein
MLPAGRRIEEAAAFRMGDEGGEAGGNGPGEAVAYKERIGMGWNLHQEKAAVPQGEGVVQHVGKKFVQIVLPARQQTEGYPLLLQLLLHLPEDQQHPPIVHGMKTADIVGRAVDRPEAGGMQSAGKLQSFGEGIRSVVDARQEVTVPVNHGLPS